MKASELIQRLLELTREEGKDLEVVYDYQRGCFDYYESDMRQPDFKYISHDDVAVEPLMWNHDGNCDENVIRIGDDW